MEKQTFEGDGISFALPKRPTFRQKLYYKSQLADREGWMLNVWRGVLPMLMDWECAALPDPHKFNLDAESDNGDAEDAVMFVAVKTSTYLADLEPDEKNSPAPSSDS